MSHEDSQSSHLEPYTYSFSASDAQTSTNPIGNENGPFDPGNTPPLIFAFVALGFTVFGLVIAIIYKRCRPLSTSLEPRYQRSIPLRRPWVEKPKLWDVWVPLDHRVSDESETGTVNDWYTFAVSPAG